MSANSGLLRARIFVAAAFVILLVRSAPAATLVPGDVYVAAGGCVHRVDGASGSSAIVFCQSPSLSAGIAAGPAGELFLTNPGTLPFEIVRLNPITGTSAKVTTFEFVPWSVTVGPSGHLFVVGFDLEGAPSLIRIDPRTLSGTRLDSPSGPLMWRATDVAVSSAGDIFVTHLGLASHGYTPGVLRVDPATGARTLVTVLSNPVGIAIGPAGELFVLAVTNESTDEGQIVRIDPATGIQTVVSSSGIRASQPYADLNLWISPGSGGIDVSPTGDLIVISSIDGRLISIDPATGARRAVSRSTFIGNLAVVPVPPAILTSAGIGGGEVRAFHWRTGMQLFGFVPYGPSFMSGVRVAAGDVNGDGVPEIVTGTGGAVPALVKVFDGRSVFAGQPQELYNLFPFGEVAIVGVFVSAADLNGDGNADLLVSTGEGDQPRVRTFNGTNGAPFGRGTIGSFLAYPAGFFGGVFVAGYQ